MTKMKFMKFNKTILYIFLNISRIMPLIQELYQKVKFEQKIQQKFFFFKNHAENEAGKLVSDFFLFFQERFVLSKSKWSAA